MPGRKLTICLIASAISIAAARAAQADAPASRSAVGQAETRPVKPARPDASESRRVGRDGGSSLWGWLRTLAALALVVGLIFAIRWVLRRLGPGAKAPAGSETLKVLARSSLSARHQLYAVRFGRRVVLVGMGPEGLTALGEITDADEIAESFGAGKAEAESRGEGRE